MFDRIHLRILQVVYYSLLLLLFEWCDTGYMSYYFYFFLLVIHFTTGNWSVHIFCFFKFHTWETIFLGICSFLLGDPWYWHVVLVISYDPLHFCGVGCNFSFSVSNFIDLGHLLISPRKIYFFLPLLSSGLGHRVIDCRTQGGPWLMLAHQWVESVQETPGCCPSTRGYKGPGQC